MAIIQCPICGKSISNRASKCVYCGQIIKTLSYQFCMECGAELSAGNLVCNKCGCPVKIQHDIFDAKHKKKALGINIAIPILGILVLVLTVIIILKNIQLQEIQNDLLDAEQVISDYEEKFVQKQNDLSNAEQVIKEYEKKENERINLERHTAYCQRICGKS